MEAEGNKTLVTRRSLVSRQTVTGSQGDSRGSLGSSSPHARFMQGCAMHVHRLSLSPSSTRCLESGGSFTGTRDRKPISPPFVPKPTAKAAATLVNLCCKEIQNSAQISREHRRCMRDESRERGRSRSLTRHSCLTREQERESWLQSLAAPRDSTAGDCLPELDSLTRDSPSS